MFSSALPKLPETVGEQITQDAGEVLGRYVGDVGRNKSQFIATPCLEATALGCRRRWRIRLSLSAGGRYNLAAIDMADLFGTSPDLNLSLNYARFNPVTGFTYKILPELMTFYAGYSERHLGQQPMVYWRQC